MIKLINKYLKGKKVKTILPNNRTAGEYPIGSYIKLKEDNGLWRRVNSDGTLTYVGFDDVNKLYSPISKAPKKVRKDYTELTFENSNYVKDMKEIYPSNLVEPYLNRLKLLLGKESEFIINTNNSPTIMFNSKSTPKRIRTAKIPIISFDSILTNAGRYDKKHPDKPIGFKNAIGIALNESTVASKNSGRANVMRLGLNLYDDTHWYPANIYGSVNYISPITMNSAWVSLNDIKINPYADAIIHFAQLKNKKGELEALNWWNSEKTLDYYNRLNISDLDSWNPYFPVYDLFLLEKNGRSLANYGDPDYKNKVYELGNGVFNTPEFLKYWNEQGIKMYNNGKTNKTTN